MRSCLVLGAGRSGTSMMAGILARSGYFTGDDYIPVRPSNPQGFFEDREVNAINEDILAGVLKLGPRGIFRHLPVYRKRLRRNQLWLATVPLNTQISLRPEAAERIRARLQVGGPFCYKDPRFCYTLPVWRPYLGKEVVFVCVFRDPLETARSTLNEVSTVPYLRNLEMSLERVLEIWSCMYLHVLRQHRHIGDWIFVHYDQLLDHSAFPRLSEVLEAELDRSLPTADLRRTVPEGSIKDPRVSSIYSDLCRLAGVSI